MAWPKLLCGIVAFFPIFIHAQGEPTVADFWDDSKIQDIRLTVDPGDWATLRQNFQADDYYKATFSWNGLGGTVGIRSRGNGSRSPIKPNLDVNITKYDKKQSFFGIKIFVLKANNQDASTIRERVVFKLFEKMGLPAPREVPARLFINDEYFGYYNIVEHLDEALLRRNFGEDSGYLYEWQTAAIYNFDYLGSNPEAYAPFLELKTDQDDPDLQWFVDLVTAINKSSDADFISSVSQYLNPRLYLTHAAVENVVGEIDGIVGGVFGMNNFYLYRFQGSNLGQLIVWDKDLSFFTPTRDIFDGTQTNVLTRRLLAIPEYRGVYLDALDKAAGLLGGANGWGDQEVSREYAQINSLATNDPNKQCIKNSTPAPCNSQDFQAGIESLHSFMAVRPGGVKTLVAEQRFTAPSGKPVVSGASIAAQNGTPRLVPGALVNVSVANLGLPGSASSYARNGGSTFLALNGVRSPIVAASSSTVTIQVPWDLQAGTATLVGSNAGELGNSFDIVVAESSPALYGFTHADGTAISSSQPAVAGETIVIYATGLGRVSEYFDPGTPAPADVQVTTTNEVSVNIGSSNARVLFAGLAPGFIGLYQVNAVVPSDGAAGRLAFSLSASNQTVADSIDVQ